MKKTYAKPEIQINSFSTEDIITSSSKTGGLTIDTNGLDADTNTDITIDMKNYLH